MCGPAVCGDLAPSPASRVLRKLGSVTSSSANNEAAAAACSEAQMSSELPSVALGVCLDQAACWDLLDGETLADAPAPAVAAGQLLLGTAAGLYRLHAWGAVHQQQQQAVPAAELFGMAGLPISHVCCSSSGDVLACCPVPDHLSELALQQRGAAAAAAGLYRLSDASTSSSSCFSGSSGAVQTAKLWHGNARCAAFAPPQPSAPTWLGGQQQQQQQRMYLGAAPAELFFSDDQGASWASSGLCDAPGAGSFYRRLPPYEPAVRSIACCGGEQQRSSTCSSTGGAADGAAWAQAPQLLVGVEVGGVLQHSTPGGPRTHFGPPPAAATAAAAEGTDAAPCIGAKQQGAWLESSQGLCRDVHVVQQDPFNARRLYAVAGSGSLPGGLYRSRGGKWKRLFGYRYSVGVAISAQHKGRLLLVCADKAPDIGCSLFESMDGGRHWANISDDVAEAAAQLTGYEPGLLEHAPAAMFVPGGLVLGCVTGHVLFGSALPGGGFSCWQLLAKLPAAINCMALRGDAGTTPVAISRS